ncbi:hypothetical protein QYE76_033768 [Lolium multiflorum]|uniref:Uncharacterized protein n=1 Tax=Lolium multiflorum TaxID=4521 RepID=A0AAD8QVW1_LOLMU|nr:hypothetical protein QYE76_033768 [Lolium multiflorum]
MSATICINRWFAPLFSSLLPSRLPPHRHRWISGRLGVDQVASRHRVAGCSRRAAPPRRQARTRQIRPTSAPEGARRLAVGAIGRCLLRVCLGAILTIDFALAMDSDDEMVALLLEDEQAFDDDLQEHLLIIASLQDMLGSIDCMHWAWKNCPFAWQGRMSSGHLVCFKHNLPLSGTLLSWSHDQMWEVMQACVIMHNMIIEDDRKNHVRSHVGPYECQGPLAEVDHELPADFADFLAMHAEIRDSNVHEQLQADLVEHLWRIKGNTVAS